MVSSEPEVAPLQAHDVPRAARLLAAALHADPAYRFLLPGEDEVRSVALADFFARNLRVHLPFACSHGLYAADGALLATMTLRPPGGVPISAVTMLRQGLLGFARANGALAVRRMLQLKAMYDEIERSVARGKPYFHVHMMAVTPAEQGRGHGSLLLASLLSERVDAEDENEHGYPTLLTTHEPKNVVFYQRAGFDVVDERVVRPAALAAPYTVWAMRRARFSEQVGARRL